METNFSNAYQFMAGAYQGFCYQSGMMSFAEMLIDGQLVSCGFQGAGLGNDSLSTVLNGQKAWFDPASYNWPYTFRLELDGQLLISDWKLSGFSQSRNEKGLLVTLLLENSVVPVQITILTCLDGTAVLTRTLKIHNSGSRPMAISRLSPMSGGLDQCQAGFVSGQSEETPYQVGYMRNPQWSNEGEFDWSTLPMASTGITGRYPESEHRHPLALVRNTQTGAYFIIQVAWSGGYQITFDVSQNLRRYHNYERTDSDFVSLSFEAGPNAPAPLRMLASGENYETPDVHVGMLFGSLDDAVAENLAHVRNILSMGKQASEAYVQNLICPGVPYTDEYLEQTLRFSQEIGADVFFIDAGWYAPPEAGDNWGIHLGDWEHRRFKSSMPEICNTVHAMGMKFGLWMEPERISDQSDASRQHPEWTTSSYSHHKYSLRQLDLSRTEVAQAVEESMARVIGDYHLDFFRLDFNLDHLGEGASNMRDGKNENNYARYYENFYSILARLRSRFPAVIFENCASGGARTDLGIIRHFDHTWITDWMSSPRNFRAINGMTLALPPEYIDHIVFANLGWWTGSVDFELDLMLFARITLGSIDTVHASPNPLLVEKLKNRIAFYKSFVVPLLPGCRVYHHTAVHRGAHPKGVGILEYTSQNKRRSMIGVFGLAGCETEDLCIKPKGLNPALIYHATYLKHNDKLTRPGMEIMRDGLPVIGLSSINSQVIVFEAVPSTPEA
ncbi:MAG: alpha-galactosidase [Bacillota bacterium]|nr:alpha-galactosidase [Bacillota bacterium]